MRNKIYRWWNCLDEIDKIKREIEEANATTNRLVDVLKFLGKQHPDIVLLLDESQRNKEYKTVASLMMVSGNDIHIDNIKVEFKNQEEGSMLLFSQIENLVLMNSQFYTTKKEIEDEE